MLPSVEEEAFPPGSLVAGKLHVVRRLGAGGMGTVYEVEHALTRHRRALKVLHTSASASVVERFLREATAAARIASPHVAETLDAGRLESGQPYLLMELLDGETLERRLHRDGPLPLGELADLIQQACEGIQAAHDAGIVHRDLKPENLFVIRRDGKPFLKILDFGISKFDERRTGAPGITREGAMVGTPYYMAPEQIHGGGHVDPQTDVYALGVILYECACGQRPFQADFIEQLAVLIHVGKPPPLEGRAPSLTPAFGEVVRCAMARSQAIRFPTARALASALEPFRIGARDAAAPRLPAETTLARDPPIDEPVPSTTVRPSEDAPPQRSRAALALALGAALLLATVAAFVLRSPGPRASGVDETASPPSPSTASSLPAAALAPLPPPTEVADAGRPTTSAVGNVARPATPSPVVTSKAPTRADRNGLAGENPFR
jgi:serine/threonine-protein kinase